MADGCRDSLDDDAARTNRAIDERIRERVAAVSFGQVLLGEGQTTVALDAAGVLTVYEPDGRTHPVDAVS
jgi:hypothetical protein